MGSLSPSTARRESCDSKQSPSAQLFVPQRLDHLKPNGAAGGKNGGADRDCHGRDETAPDMPYSVRCPAAVSRHLKTNPRRYCRVICKSNPQRRVGYGKEN